VFGGLIRQAEETPPDGKWDRNRDQKQKRRWACVDPSGHSPTTWPFRKLSGRHSTPSWRPTRPARPPCPGLMQTGDSQAGLRSAQPQWKAQKARSPSADCSCHAEPAQPVVCVVAAGAGVSVTVAVSVGVAVVVSAAASDVVSAEVSARVVRS
jgi:hypothetical protein